jgi:hypothetical protein
MRLPVLYCSAGESRWHHGVTVNLSDAGALIDGDEPSRSAATLTVVILLPSSGGCLTGLGRIVPRPASCAGEDRRFAIVVSRYRLQRQSVALAGVDALHQGC